MSLSPSRTIRYAFPLLGLALLAAGTARGQFAAPVPANVAPAYLPPPLYLRFVGPTGMRVTFYPGDAGPKTLTAPFRSAVRPGYAYRVKLSDMPNQPGLTVYPTLEVRGSVQGGAKLQAREHPAVLHFTDEDFDKVRAGSVITKVVLLERQSTAIPLATTPENPLEIKLEGGEDPLRVAAERGIPLVIVRMGLREVGENDLARGGIPGTILLPGEGSLGTPPVAPWLPWACPLLYDPYYGPAWPHRDYCLPDGGDVGLRAGVDNQGRLLGVDPSDTVASYVDAEGRRRVAVSNRVCLCVPRFLVVRSELQLADRVAYAGPNELDRATGFVVQQAAVPPLQRVQNVQLQGVGNRIGPSEAAAAQGTVIYGQVNGLDVMVNVNGIKGVSGLCQAPEEQLMGRPLLLIKWPDKSGAQIGETITFTLKYVNQGATPIANVVIADNLVSRFEYVAGTAESDRPANFTTQPNQDGSALLRWEIADELPPGQSGIVRFQVRVR